MYEISDNFPHHHNFAFPGINCIAKYTNDQCWVALRTVYYWHFKRYHQRLMHISHDYLIGENPSSDLCRASSSSSSVASLFIIREPDSSRNPIKSTDQLIQRTVPSKVLLHSRGFSTGIQLQTLTTDQTLLFIILPPSTKSIILTDSRILHWDFDYILTNYVVRSKNNNYWDSLLLSRPVCAGKQEMGPKYRQLVFQFRDSMPKSKQANKSNKR